MKKLFAAVAVLTMMALAVPVMAASEAPGYGVVIGGRIKADLGWQFLSKEQSPNYDYDTDTGDAITNFFLTSNSNNYLRAVFTSADKNTGVFIEYGFGSWSNNSNRGIDADNEPIALRHAYGWWKVGSCKLIVGQFGSRVGDAAANQWLGTTKAGKVNLQGFGFIGSSRNPKVAFEMAVNEMFGFNVAIGQAGSENSLASSLQGAYTGTGIATNSWLPKFELVFDFTFSGDWGNLMISPGGGISYQKIKENDELMGGDFDDNSVLAWVVVVPVRFNYGPFRATLNAYYGHNVDTDWTGENNITSTPFFSLTSFGMYGGQPGSLAAAQLNDNGQWEIEDTKTWGVGLDLGYTFTEQLSLSVGGGVTALKNSAWDVGGDSKDNYYRFGVYAALPYKLTSNFTIAPEIGYYNYGDEVANFDKSDKVGDEWLVGIHFQFLF